MYKKWNINEENYLKMYSELKTDKELAEYFNVSLNSLRRKRQELGIKKASGRGISQIINIDKNKFYKI